MPKCMNCGENYPAVYLRQVQEKIVCGECEQVVRLRKLAIVKESPMAESKRHLVASINVFEIETADGGRDHLAEVQVGVGGLNVKFDATFDQIRDFFTKRREQHTTAKAKLVS